MRIFLALAFLVFFNSCKNEVKQSTQPTVETEKSLMAGNDTLIYPEEKYFKSIRQITFGGDNAEAYWNWNDTQLVFQSNNKGWG